MLDRLVVNALDFLERSLDDFESAPKYSVIHFYAAVELFLKARLLAEHWSLVVTKRQDPDMKRFEVGDFQSVSLEEAAYKLDKVLQSPLTHAELTQFRNLAKHRNRMVHFFHEVTSAKNKNALKRQIAIEQLRAWYLLNRLLLERWDDVFGKWKNGLDKVTAGLKRHYEYLQVVYVHVEPTIKAMLVDGSAIEKCPSCGFESAKVKEILGDLKSVDCFVCQFEAECLTVACPKCNNPITFINDGFTKCSNCGHKVEPQGLAELLVKDHIGSKGYFESGLPAHCKFCDGYQTVIEYGGGYLCTSCFEVYEAEDIHQCEWCGDLNAEI